MSKTDKILTFEYLNWHAKLTGLPSVLTDRIRSSLYKKYKKETGYEPWQLSEAHASEASLLERLIIIILYLLSRGTRHALFVMENIGIMDYMAHGTVEMGISFHMILN